jgi:hypothetical protein
MTTVKVGERGEPPHKVYLTVISIRLRIGGFLKPKPEA